MARVIKPVQLIVLGCASIGAFYATAEWPPGKEPGREPSNNPAAPARDAMPRAPLPASAAASSSSLPARAGALTRADRSSLIPGLTGDPFVAMSWLPPPPPPPPIVAPAPAPPAAPVAPPLPFAFVGMVEQGTARPQAFLAKGDALLIVSAGETIDGGTYRIEAMDPNQIVITHLLTNTQQTINVSGGSK